MKTTQYRLDEAEWEVLYLLYEALDQLHRLTFSFSESRYLAIEHTEQEIREAVESLLTPQADGRPQLIVQVPNLAGLPIYRIAPLGRDLVQAQKDHAAQRP